MTVKEINSDMNSYNGIEISEIKLIFDAIVFTAITVVGLVVLVLFFVFSYDKNLKKSRIRIYT